MTSRITTKGRAGLAGLAAALITLGTTASLMAVTPASASTSAAGRAAATSGYPGAGNTGVPAGTSLRTVPGQVASGPGWYFDKTQQVVQVTGTGAVLSGLYIPYTVNVKANNVTLTNDKIVAYGATSFGVALRHASNVTVSHSTISGRSATSGRLMVGIKDIYGDATGTQVLADNIFWTSTGVQIETGLIQDNYLHDPGYLAGDHINGVTSNGGTQQLTINHNTIFNSMSQTDAVGLFEDFGVQANRTISNNLLAGGGYTIYGGQNSGGPATYNIKITGNRISTMYFAKGGYWGPVTAFNPAGQGNVWSGNVWDSTGQVIPSP
jgi:hypothetical protein